MNPLTPARAVAAVISLATFVYLFVHDSWRLDNLFLVPDLLLCAALLAAALLPAARARGALLFAFGMGAGVLSAAAAAYLVRGEWGGASLLGAVVCAAMALALLWRPVPATPAPALR